MGKPILLVVDNEGHLVRALEHHAPDQFRVFTARSGADALALLEREDIDVILSNQRIAGMSGIEVLEQARRLRPNSVGMIVTAYTDVEMLVAALNQSAAEYVPKSWDVERVRHNLLKAALQQNERFVEWVHQLVPIGFYIYDAAARRYVFANARAAATLGYTPETMPPIDAIWSPQFAHPEDRARIDEYQDRIARARDGEIVEIECRIKNAQNAWVWVDCRASILVRTHDGDPKLILGTLQDISETKRAEEALRESEQKFYGVVEQSSDGIVFVDERGIIIEWNPRQEQITGLKKEEALGKPIWDLQNRLAVAAEQTPQRRARRRDAILNALRTRQAEWFGKTGEVTARRADGAIRTWESIAYPINTDKGFWLGSVTRDITERKQVEEEIKKLNTRLEQRVAERTAQLEAVNIALEESQAFIDQLIAASSGVIFQLRAHDFIVTYVSPNVQRIFGYAPAEILDVPLWWQRHVHPTDHAAIFAQFGYAHSVQAENIEFEFRLRCKDDSYHWFYCVLRLDYDAAGNPTSSLGSALDITEHKQAEEARRSAEARLRELVTRGPAMIYSARPAGNYATTFISENVMTQLGYSAREFIQDPGFWAQHIHPQDAPRVFAEMARVNEKSCVCEYRFQHKNGEYRWIRNEISLVRDAENAPLELVGSWFDITAQKQAEEALQKNKDRLEMEVAERTTELSTALARIRSELEERKRAEEQVKNSQAQLRALSAHLQSVREEEGARIAREVHDGLGQALTALRLDLAWLSHRLPKNQTALHAKTTSMLNLVDNTVKMVKKISTELRPQVLDDLGLQAAIEWQAQQFQARTRIRCEITLALEEDNLDRDIATAIFRIFQEILTNVTRHAKATKVCISLKEDQGNLIFRVEDNGKGITPRAIADPKSLGLLSMRERALLLGGQVEIRRTGRKGTTVTTTIPLPKSSAGREEGKSR